MKWHHDSCFARLSAVLESVDLVIVLHQFAEMDVKLLDGVFQQ